MLDFEMIIEHLKVADIVYVYGAGKRASEYVVPALISYGIKIDAILVSDKSNNCEHLNGINIIEFNPKNDYKNATIIVSIKNGEEALSETLNKSNIKEVLYCNADIIEKMRQYLYLQSINKRLSGLYVDSKCNYMEPAHLQLADKLNSTRFCRIPQYVDKAIMEERLELCTKKAFEEIFGKTVYIFADEELKVSDKFSDDDMFIVTSHFDDMNTEIDKLKGFNPIQVGTELTNVRKNCIHDNDGDNISARNRDYCECTAIYWVWKNYKSKGYIGLSHYRRRLMVNDAILEKLYADNIDMLLAMPEFTGTNVKDFILRFVKEKDWELMDEAILTKWPEFTSAHENVSQGRFIFPCNISFMKREWFDLYCEFAFSITEYIHDYYEHKGINRNDRYMGYLFEYLESLFVSFYKKQLVIAYTDVKWIDVKKER